MIFWNFEFGKNEQFSITDYTKTNQHRKKIPNNIRLLALRYQTKVGSVFSK